eukprot:CAMPEP_0184481442 /NCGR_PEP_ID=MMETSP0113_2-20130426/2982_1 /TAXON_ID=91329 /ORGANISM="Norrisiella sphaerica, Strain BC52" /LENGTH=321 /DNA_ID=CAMNT_0026860567 /DNA_START=155 /DNA_END=1120 /DNA_ORIENTATION=-
MLLYAIAFNFAPADALSLCFRQQIKLGSPTDFILQVLNCVATSFAFGLIVFPRSKAMKRAALIGFFSNSIFLIIWACKAAGTKPVPFYAQIIFGALLSLLAAYANFENGDRPWLCSMDRLFLHHMEEPENPRKHGSFYTWTTFTVGMVLALAASLVAWAPKTIFEMYFTVEMRLWSDISHLLALLMALWTLGLGVGAMLNPMDRPMSRVLLLLLTIAAFGPGADAVAGRTSGIRANQVIIDELLGVTCWLMLALANRDLLYRSVAPPEEEEEEEGEDLEDALHIAVSATSSGKFIPHNASDLYGREAKTSSGDYKSLERVA